MNRFGMLGFLVLVSASSAYTFGLEPKDSPTVKDFSLADSKGTPHTPLEWKDKKAVVLFFLGTECPVSNGYAPEFARHESTFRSRGIAFYGVHADPDVTAKEANRHAAEYRLTFPILLDPKHALARQVGVSVVPEAVVLSPDGRLLYRGRIDDRYSLDGKRREEPKIRDLEIALTAILEGKAPPVARTKAFGCPLPAPTKE